MADEEIPDVCKVTPEEEFRSTYLNSAIKSFKEIRDKILLYLGYPSTSVILHEDQLNEAIRKSIELYTKYCGHTEECLVFTSKVYNRVTGVDLSKLYTIAMVEQIDNPYDSRYALRSTPSRTITTPKDMYVCKVPIDREDYLLEFDEDGSGILRFADNIVSESNNQYVISESGLPFLNEESVIYIPKEIQSEIWKYSSHYPNGIKVNEIISYNLYEHLIKNVKKSNGEPKYTKDNFFKCKDAVMTMNGERVDLYTEDAELGRVRDDINYSEYYDYDLNTYRKVKNVKDFVSTNYGYLTGAYNTDMMLLASSYYSRMLGTRGFDITSYYAMTEWAKTRNKVLSTERTFTFNPDTQRLKIFPEPKPYEYLLAAVCCYLEKPLKDIVKSPWVLEYAVAEAKEMYGRVRSAYGDNIALPGGGVISGNSMLSEAASEKERLRNQLIQSNGYGEADPPCMLIG